ncbi:MAG: Guanylate kinase [Planctomycetota bacterium]
MSNNSTLGTTDLTGAAAEDQPGKLIVVSGPSGSGKTTVLAQLLNTCPLPLTLSVSATTRPPRPGEIHGREYWFLTDEEFRTKRSRGEFLESKEVFGRGYWYGTLRQSVSTGLREGKWVILEIDVQGALSVLDYDPEAITIFIDAGSMETLENRLRSRGTETEEVIQRRLEVAREEMGLMHKYRHRVINHSVDASVTEICRLLCRYDTRIAS